MAKYKLEYLWLDGYTPVANIRGKTKIAEFDDFPTLCNESAYTTIIQLIQRLYNDLAVFFDEYAAIFNNFARISAH